MKLTIQELAEKFNELQLAKKINTLPNNEQLDYKTSDKRVREDISVRRIQSYITQGLLDKPIKEGNRAYYTEEHLNKLISLRMFAESGLSDKSLRNIDYISTQLNTSTDNTVASATSFSDETLRNDALLALQEIQGKSFFSGTNAAENNSLSFLSGVGTSLLKTTRNWQEYQLDKDGSVFIKVELGKVLTEEEKIELVSGFKKFLNMEK